MPNVDRPALAGAQEARELVSRFRKAIIENRTPDAGDEEFDEMMAAQKALLAALSGRPTEGSEPVVWENFPAFLIDHCEGDRISEEVLQHALADMLSDPKYSTPAAASQDARDAARYRWLSKFYVPAGDRYDDWDDMDTAFVIGGQVLDAAIDAKLDAIASMAGQTK